MPGADDHAPRRRRRQRTRRVRRTAGPVCRMADSDEIALQARGARNATGSQATSALMFPSLAVRGVEDQEGGGGRLQDHGGDASAAERGEGHVGRCRARPPRRQDVRHGAGSAARGGQQAGCCRRSSWDEGRRMSATTPRAAASAARAVAGDLRQRSLGSLGVTVGELGPARRACGLDPRQLDAQRAQRARRPRAPARGPHARSARSPRATREPTHAGHQPHQREQGRAAEGAITTVTYQPPSPNTPVPSGKHASVTPTAHSDRPRRPEDEQR